MNIGDLATTAVVSVGPGHSLVEAARRMTSRNVGSAVVLTDGGPGIITERDLLRAIADGVDPEQANVGDYMTANAITASSSWDVMEAARRMSEGGFRHLIVLDDSGGVAGMLSLRDLVQTLLQHLSST